MGGRFVTLPKAEVHVHLEGCFEVEDIVRLADENDVQLPRPRDQLFQLAASPTSCNSSIGFAAWCARGNNLRHWRGASASAWRRPARAMPMRSSIRPTGTFGRAEFPN